METGFSSVTPQGCSDLLILSCTSGAFWVSIYITCYCWCKMKILQPSSCLQCCFSVKPLGFMFSVVDFENKCHWHDIQPPIKCAVCSCRFSLWLCQSHWWRAPSVSPSVFRPLAKLWAKDILMTYGHIDAVTHDSYSGGDLRAGWLSLWMDVFVSVWSMQWWDG